LSSKDYFRLSYLINCALTLNPNRNPNSNPNRINKKNKKIKDFRKSTGRFAGWKIVLTVVCGIVCGGRTK
jgi:hypothetical protein